MTLKQKMDWSRKLTIVSFIGLLVLYTLWSLFIHPIPSGRPWVIWALHFLPLAAFIPTVKSGNPRGHAWLCFVLILYFNEAVLAATTHIETRMFGIIGTALVTVLFTASMMYARWGSQYKRQTQQ